MTTMTRDMICKGKKAARERKRSRPRNRKMNDGTSARFVFLSLEQELGAHKKKAKKDGTTIACFDEARRWSLYT